MFKSSEFDEVIINLADDSDDDNFDCTGNVNDKLKSADNKSELLENKNVQKSVEHVFSEILSKEIFNNTISKSEEIPSKRAKIKDDDILKLFSEFDNSGDDNNQTGADEFKVNLLKERDRSELKI